MSETEINKGKLNPTGKTVEQYMNGKEIPDYCDSLEEAFVDLFYRKAYCYKGFVYEIELEGYEDDDIFESSKNEDGSINFLLKYYNGGCGFSEALDYATNKLKP